MPTSTTLHTERAGTFSALAADPRQNEPDELDDGLPEDEWDDDELDEDLDEDELEDEDEIEDWGEDEDEVL